jgi:hypothetical protein
MVGMPPFHHWERPSFTARIPANRTDAGVYLMAEFLGARSMIYVKDEDGLIRTTRRRTLMRHSILASPRRNS